jgi:hypothetical protein
MNEDTKKAMDALAGAGTDGGNAEGGATDWKAKYEEMERKFHSAQVEQGRVKKLDEEVKALRTRLADAETLRRAKEEVASLGEDSRGDVPEDYLVGAGVMAQKMAAQAIAEKSAEFERRMAERDAQDRVAAENRFAARIEQEFPGFLASAVIEGGDKHAAWTAYQRYNAASIQAAMRSFDYDTLAYHIRQFYTNNLGIEPPSGGAGRAAPDPGSIGGGKPVVATPGRTYTQEEISNLYDEVEKARDRGDFAEVKRIGAEIDKAMREGRVK